MTNLEKYKGIIPAFYAAYDDDGNISPERVEALAKYYRDKNVKGLYVGGSSGECIYQSVEERKIVLEHVMKAVGDDLTIIAHVACNSTRESIELAKHADRLGVDALAAIPPHYFFLNEEAIYNYWMAMVESTTKDFFIYNIPQNTGYTLSVNLLRKMLKDDRVIGVKNSSMATMDIYLFKSLGLDEIIVFNGPDEQFVSGRIMGADGGIGGTYGVMPELFLAADKAFKDGEIELARQIQFDINKIIVLLTTDLDGHMYDVIKTILRKNGMNIGEARLPLPRVSKSDLLIIEKIDNLIKDTIKKYSDS